MLFSRKSGQPGAITLADRARDAWQWEAAARLYRSALERNPDRAPIWVQYGHALKESGKHDHAEAAYRRAIGCAPRDADAHLHLGHVLRLQGKPGEARSAYLRALALDPRLTNARSELRRLGWRESDPAELESVVAGLPGTALPDLSSGSRITRADAARDAALWGLAAALYRAALRRNPPNPAIWVQYGHSLKEDGKLPEAEAAYRRALAYNPAPGTSRLS